jgi:hypothetical protein
MSPAHLAAARTIFRHFTPEEAAALQRSVEPATTAKEVETVLRAAAFERVGEAAHAFLRHS